MKYTIKPKDSSKADEFIDIINVPFKHFKNYVDAILNEEYETIISLGVKQKLNLDNYSIPELQKLMDEIKKQNDEAFFEFINIRKANAEYVSNAITRLS